VDSSAVGIAQLEHAADESIFCMRGGYVAVPKLLWHFMFFVVELLTPEDLLDWFSPNLVLSFVLPIH